jgi:hypothetical protein
MKDVYVTVNWVSGKRALIKDAIDFESYAQGSPRRILIEQARDEFRYSDNTLPIDIWGAIIRIYNLYF